MASSSKEFPWLFLEDKSGGKKNSQSRRAETVRATETGAAHFVGADNQRAIFPGEEAAHCAAQTLKGAYPFCRRLCLEADRITVALNFHAIGARSFPERGEGGGFGSAPNPGGRR
ncbi:hypothetical protein MRX96_036787 [Rhipicephalus microplus]